ncbi:protoporphyrinogen oxidase isoform X2 [Pristis pectinata]|uniref:protoporphyrinogen oxidase isoform X2 n=1 Tax=Pristis pectinata TaxID=685728 RepID=UPI00223DD7E0|nr:protoporphyrinogen oxidase isoform X2 [Pristis pectinata]
MQDGEDTVLVQADGPMPRTVVVVGAGVSGLAAALHLTRTAAAPKVVLLEARERTGGWLQTTRTEEGAIFEHGPRGVRTSGAVGKNTLQLVSELGLDPEVLPVTYSNAVIRNRYLFTGGKLCALPSSIRSVFSRLPPFSLPLVHSLVREPFVRRSREADESVHGFFTRRFGQELADYGVDSLCRGVFAGDSRRLSVRSCFPALFQAEQSFGSVLLGMLAGAGATKWDGVQTGMLERARRERWAQWTLRAGMQALPEAMEAALRSRGVEIHLHTPVTQIRPTADGACQVLIDGGTLTADHVFSSVPARVLNRLLPPAWHPLTEALSEIASVSVAVVNLEYKGLVLPVLGFGHLVPSAECGEILGVVYDSCAFPQQDRPGQPTTRLTVMMGGSWFTAAFGEPGSVGAELLRQRAITAVRQQLGIAAQPLRTIVRVHQDCIPQYGLGHWKLLTAISEFIEHNRLPLTLIGASYQGVSVNDCIYQAQRGVECLRD